jgi:hypothetical protein
MAMPDAATLLMPTGTYNSNQSFPALQVYPRQLATSMVTMSLQSPPTGAATFVVEVASTQAGPYRETARLAWPAGLSGSRDVPLGVSASAAWMQNNQSTWMRLSLTTSTALTGSAWLAKSSDGAPGRGAGPNSVFTGTAA